MTTITPATTDISATIIAMEKAALEKWYQGNPDGYLEISTDDVVYFDPFTEQRIDGLEALKKHYDPIRGKIHVLHYDMPNPRVQAVNDMAVLTFNLHSFHGDVADKWNCTEVYQLDNGGKWKIIQSHWSFIKPELK